MEKCPAIPCLDTDLQGKFQCTRIFDAKFQCPNQCQTPIFCSQFSVTNSLPTFFGVLRIPHNFARIGQIIRVHEFAAVHAVVSAVLNLHELQAYNQCVTLKHHQNLNMASASSTDGVSTNNITFDYDELMETYDRDLAGSWRSLMSVVHRQFSKFFDKYIAWNIDSHASMIVDVMLRQAVAKKLKERLAVADQLSSEVSLEEDHCRAEHESMIKVATEGCLASKRPVEIGFYKHIEDEGVQWGFFTTVDRDGILVNPLLVPQEYTFTRRGEHLTTLRTDLTGLRFVNPALFSWPDDCSNECSDGGASEHDSGDA